MEAYLDHAASTPMRPEAIEAMLPFLATSYANPSGGHRAARVARRALDDARDAMAEAIGCEPGDIIFTAGGTEADNLAVLGTTESARDVVVTSAIEHHAVLAPSETRAARIAPVDCAGRLDLDAFTALLDGDVRLVSLMAVNNEVGTVQPVEEVAELTKRLAPNAVVHTDAVQALTWLDLRQTCKGADLISLSAHKFGGPKGVGVLAVRPGVALRARVVGGGQERDRRSGTQNVAGIVAMATAARLTVASRSETVARLGLLRDRLLAGLSAQVPGLVPTVAADAGAEVAAGILHVCIPGVESEAVLFLLEEADIYAAAGSSCSSGAIQLSHVLSAMGTPTDIGRGALRLSLGYASADSDVDAVLDALPRAVDRLRQSSS